MTDQPPRWHALRTDRHPVTRNGWTHPATCHGSRAEAEEHVSTADPADGDAVTEWRVVPCTCDTP